MSLIKAGINRSKEKIQKLYKEENLLVRLVTDPPVLPFRCGDPENTGEEEEDLIN